MSKHNIHTILRDPRMPDTLNAFKDQDGNYRVRMVEAAPSGSEAGYAKGCLWLDTTNGALHINTGTGSSATWTSIGGAGAEDFGASGVAADLVSESTSGSGVTIDGALVKDGILRSIQAAPTAKTTTAGLEAAEILGGLITVTHAVGSNQDYQLPLGTELEAIAGVANNSFDWSIINLSGTPATNTATITVDTGHTIVGSAVVGDTANASALFRTRRSGANTFVTYRLA